MRTHLLLVERYGPEVGDCSKMRVKREINKTVTLGSRTLRGPGIPKGNGQVIYFNTIPDWLSCTTQLSKANSSSSAVVSTPFWLTHSNYIISNDPSHDLSRIQKTAQQSKKSLFILKLAKSGK
ncbi:hypothetical protein CDL15_Pgr008069 [Punica granatum]|uniref:Uncharacterized protein n=1 Tax=Punica granatum TaxID=22663 RepID=A0A218WN53_PUNGR|nr:hypothetical protein CDL15_Pgr008069 [Punica granatum]